MLIVDRTSQQCFLWGKIHKSISQALVVWLLNSKENSFVLIFSPDPSLFIVIIKQQQSMCEFSPFAGEELKAQRLFDQHSLSCEYLYNNWGLFDLPPQVLHHSNNLPKNFKLWRCYWRWFQDDWWCTLLAISIQRLQLLHSLTFQDITRVVVC